jgi:CBS domain-containing protein
MLVEDLMSTDIVTCDYEASLQVAVVKLLQENVGSVIVTRDGEPIGIVTETDALLAGASLKRPFEEIPIKKVASHPLITITRDTTIRKAVERMKTNNIKKLPVVEELELKGIITVSDIAVNHSEIIQDARRLAEQRDRWEARKADIDEF